GRPCVATAVDGVPDLIEHGVSGLLTPARDPRAAACAVCWMLDHPGEARAMGERGRVRAEAGFSPERMCVAIDACYRELLGQPDRCEVAMPNLTAPSGEGVPLTDGVSHARLGISVPSHAPDVAA